MFVKIDFIRKVWNELRFLIGFYFLNIIFKLDYGWILNNNVIGINYCVNIDEIFIDEIFCVSNVLFWFYFYDFSEMFVCDLDKVLKICYYFFFCYNVVFWFSF